MLTLSNSGLCCGQPWDSKGFVEDAVKKSREIFEMLYQKSDSGRVPVVIDNSPCEQSLREFIESPDASVWLNGRTLDLWDPVDFALYLSSKLKLKPITYPVRFFTVCSVHKSGRKNKFLELAQRLAPMASFPDQEACCGMAGDRGAWIPELIQNAKERFHWGDTHSRTGFCTSRTCEAALSTEERTFYSVFHALEQASRP
jgi:D-lactate dehydrogenase